MTTKIGLVITDDFKALDIPGYNDANTTVFDYTSMLTRVLYGKKIDGIFLTIKSTSYRITTEII
jgi:hypothetical protein